MNKSDIDWYLERKLAREAKEVEKRREAAFRSRQFDMFPRSRVRSKTRTRVT